MDADQFKVEKAGLYSCRCYISFCQFLICLRCSSLCSQCIMNNSTRINRAAVQNATNSHHTYCIKIHFINLCIGLNIPRAHRAITEGKCKATKHVLNFDVGLASSHFIFSRHFFFFKKRELTKLSFASH